MDEDDFEDLRRGYKMRPKQVYQGLTHDMIMIMMMMRRRRRYVLLLERAKIHFRTRCQLSVKWIRN